MEEMDLDEIISNAKNGQYQNVAKSGHTECYAVREGFVLVPHHNEENARRFVELSKQLNTLGINCVYTVVDYTMQGDICYELQKRAIGEHFRTDGVKQTKLDSIENIKRRIERLQTSKKIFRDTLIEAAKKDLQKEEEFMQTEEYARLLDTRKEELLNRYNRIIQMPQEHIQDFFKAILILADNKIEYDSQGNNVLYDEQNGFAIIDLDDVSKLQPNIRGELKHLLDESNCHTMRDLLGTNKINEVPEEERPECLEAMREALKKIVISVFDLEHGSQKMSKEVIEKSLTTYKKYGIDLTYEEIVQEMQKEAGTQQLGKETVSVQSETAYIDETSQAMEEQRRLIGQQQANDRTSI